MKLLALAFGFGARVVGVIQRLDGIVKFAGLGFGGCRCCRDLTSGVFHFLVVTGKLIQLLGPAPNLVLPKNILGIIRRPIKVNTVTHGFIWRSGVLANEGWYILDVQREVALGAARRRGSRRQALKS